MKKSKFLVLLFVIFSNISFTQVIDTIINRTEFKIVTVSNNQTEQTEYVEIYRNDKKILTHILSKFEGDCSSENIQLGKYEIKDSSLIFYSYWASGDRMMKNVYPYGFRKQIYSVNKKGIVSLKSSILYIETYIDEWSVHEGMKYLKVKAKSDKELKLLKDYISKAEKMYFGSFVFGKTKKTLEKEVRKKLETIIIENTNSWKEIYGENCNL